MRTTNIILIICTLFSCVSCLEWPQQIKSVEKDDYPYILQFNELGLYKKTGGQVLLDLYDIQLVQIDESNKTNSILSSDNRKEYISVNLMSNVKYITEGAELTAHKEIKIAEENDSSDCKLKVMKIQKEDDLSKVWLWDDDSKTGYITYYYL